MTDLDWRAVHALLAEHFEISLGSNYTGFQVEPQDPVVVVHQLADARNLAPQVEQDLRNAALLKYEALLNTAGYSTLWGTSALTGEPALMIMEKL